MKTTLKLITIFFSAIIISCGGKEEKKKETFSYKKKTTTEKTTTNAPKKIKASDRVVLDNKGIGPIKKIDLENVIDDKMAKQGSEIFKKMCTACHRPDKKFIGPAPTGILDRRTPEWVMNMILNPEVMIKEDPLAKDLLIEFNGAPMANQGLSEEDARAVLEYFRTLK